MTSLTELFRKEVLREFDFLRVEYGYQHPVTIGATWVSSEVIFEGDRRRPWVRCVLDHEEEVLVYLQRGEPGNPPAADDDDRTILADEILGDCRTWKRPTQITDGASLEAAVSTYARSIRDCLGEYLTGTRELPLSPSSGASNPSARAEYVARVAADLERIGYLVASGRDARGGFFVVRCRCTWNSERLRSLPSVATAFNGHIESAHDGEPYSRMPEDPAVIRTS